MPLRRAALPLLLGLLTACGGAAQRSGVVSGAPVLAMPETTASPILESPPAEPTATALTSPAAAASTRAATSPGLQPPPALAGAEWTRLPTAARLVALTFDAGGNDAGVASILATLAREGVPGTFFLTGRWSQYYPDQARRVAAAAAVGNHTETHPHLTELGDAQVAAEVTQGEQAIRQTTGRQPRPLFRFPYGDVDARVLADVHRLGYGGIRWTVDTLGWEGRGAGQSVDTVVARATGAAGPGEIVLMHVGSAQDASTLDADALPQVIAALRARGYGFASVADFSGR